MRSFRPEPISYPQLGHQIAGACRIGLQFVAQLPHIHAKIMTLVHVQRPPDLFQQLSMGEHFPGMPHERGEQFVFDWCEVNFFFRREYLPSSEINPQRTDRKN